MQQMGARSHYLPCTVRGACLFFTWCFHLNCFWSFSCTYPPTNSA